MAGRRRFGIVAAGLAVVVVAACAVNPATGRKQLSFFGHAEEIELGAEVDREFLSTSDVYDDPALESYVAGLGRRLAAVSERPDLPWTFRVVDDPIVNAFALPGGFIYVTRGLLAHLNREAELAGVLGHEVGHVTARHSVHGLSRDLAIAAGVLAGLALVEADETAQTVAVLGLGLLTLKFGRNQERQADQLGVRYAERAGLEPHGVVDALRVLQAVSQAQGDGWFPVWLSTHPDPDNRWQRLAAETGLGPGRPASELEPEVDDFLARLDGLVWGPDPRNGAVRENAYVHLRDGFRLSFPAGWKIQREGQTLAAADAAGEALLWLQPQLQKSESEAAAAFSEQDGIAVQESWSETLGGLAARLVRFDATVEERRMRGLAAFVRTPRRVVAVLGVTPADLWPERRAALESAVRSIGGVGPGEDRAAEPARLAIVTLDRTMTAREIAGRYSPGVEPATLALLNQVGLDEPIRAGRRVKTIRAGG